MVSLIIFILVAVCSYGAYKLNALSKSGAIAAFILGFCIVLGFGGKGLILIGLFFSSSSMFSSYKKRVKQVVNKKLANGSRRNWAQVIANGGPAGISSLLYFIYDDSIWLIAFIVSIAAATSDTWSSELGVLSKSNPIHIIGLKRCEPGTSGAISMLGSMAGIAGSVFIVVTADILFDLTLSTIILLSVFGYLGSILDTLIGAFWQVEYKCTVCSAHTERKVHCNKLTVKRKGVNWINNEFVNLSSVMISSMLCMIIWHTTI